MQSYTLNKNNILLIHIINWSDAKTSIIGMKAIYNLVNLGL